jgi:DNA mismatch repair protein MutS2
MMEETLRVLEYEKISGILAGFTATTPGREKAVALRPLSSDSEVAASLAQTSEMVSLLASAGAPPVGGNRDLRQMLRQLRAEGAWLAPEALLDVLSSVEAAADCRRYFSNAQEAPRLAERAAELVPLSDLRQQIRGAVGSRGEILDSASFELGDLRHEIQQTRTRIRRTLERLLSNENLASAFQERIVTERGGRYVVPVRADHRGQVKGFVHDESASGQTLFVEPTVVLEENNRLQTLIREEQREIERILRRLCALVRRDAEALAANQEILAHLDFTAACGRFSVACDGSAPQLSQEPLIELCGARHPLLLINPDGSARGIDAVPVDIRLGEGRDTLVISGPNTGGKTVTLKTAGLLLLMARSGLHLPCRPESRVHLFRRIFADIGDEQSIEESLSTFSGHLTRIGRILGEADDDSLVLLDEAGTGTDPAEGGALALAVLDALRARGTRVILTTHLNLLKGYAHLREGVENAAVEFDSVSLSPTYRLHYGIPGASNAFTIARRLGLPDDVLQAAGRYLGEGEREGLELIEELNRLRKDLEAELEEAHRLRSEAAIERERRRRLLHELEGQKRTVLEKAARRGEERVKAAERSLKSLLEEARQGSAAPPERARLAGELHQVRQDVATLKPESPRKGRAPREVRPGEILRIPALGAEGEVVRVVGAEVELTIAGKKLRRPLNELEQPSPRRFAAKRKSGGAVKSHIEREGFQPRLMLVGMRLDDAIPLLERFLDDALLHGMKHLEVVHGSGEGILRRAVRDALARHREVSAFHGADPNQGGENVTVIELRG